MESKEKSKNKPSIFLSPNYANPGARHPILKIPNLPLSNDLNELIGQSQTAREEGQSQKISDRLKNVVSSTRALRSARDSKNPLRKSAGLSVSATAIPVKTTLFIPPPQQPQSPIKTRNWSQITLEKANELGLDPINFLEELHDMLLDEKDANSLFLEVGGFSKLIQYLHTSSAPLVRKVLEIIFDSLQEKVVFIKLFIENPDNLIKITDLLLKFSNQLSVKSQVYQILSLLPEATQSLELNESFDAHSSVMCALYYYKSKSKEKLRFEHLVTSFETEILRENFSEETCSPEESDEYALAVFKLISSLVEGYDIVDDRISIREEFGKLGLDPVLELVLEKEKYKDSMLAYLLQAYLMAKDLDMNQIQTQEFSKLIKNQKSEAIQITKEIEKKFSSHAHIQNLFVNSLQSMNRMDENLAKWLFFDKIISELATENIDLLNWLNEAKINLDTGINIQRLFACVINDEHMRQEVIELKEKYSEQDQKIIEQDSKIQKKKVKIRHLKNDLISFEEELVHVEENLTSKVREVDSLLEEYDAMLDEYEEKFDKINAELETTKNSLYTKNLQYNKLLAGDFTELNPDSRNLLYLKFQKGTSEEPLTSLDDPSTPHTPSTHIPKWKLQQQKLEKELQERRERERATKLSKVNFIRKRIKEIGHDAVSHTLEDEDVSVPPVILVSPSNDSQMRMESKSKISSIRHKNISRPKLELELFDNTLPATIEELQLKLEKVKVKKKTQKEVVIKLEKDIQQKSMQILAFEKEKEARSREEKKIQIKMQRTEEEKENLQRQRTTLQEDMKKLAQQREKLNNEAKKDRLQISKSKQEIDKLRQTLDEERESFAKEQERVKNELDEKLDQLRIEKEFLEEDLMLEYLELQELLKNTKLQLQNSANNTDNNPENLSEEENLMRALLKEEQQFLENQQKQQQKNLENNEKGRPS